MIIRAKFLIWKLNLKLIATQMATTKNELRIVKNKIRNKVANKTSIFRKQQRV